MANTLPMEKKIAAVAALAEGTAKCLTATAVRGRILPVITKKVLANVMGELGRRGRGAAKRRGSSAYYRRLGKKSAAKRRKAGQ